MRKRTLICMLCGFYCLTLMAGMVIHGAATAPNAELFLANLPRMVALFIGVLGVVLAWLAFLALQQDPLEVPALTNPDARNSLSVAYDIKETVGQGGMGVILRAKHRLLAKDVAIKMLDGEAIADLDAVRRFKHEAQTSARLQHPNIVSVFDFGVLPGGKCYLVMDYVDGRSLSDILKERGSLPLVEALPIFISIAEALQCAHSNNVVHRDLKPANVMITKDGVVKLVDFGIAKVVDDNSGPALTRTGQAPGTPNYMSPEQCTGDPIDHRTDIYSFGCLIFEVLSGVLPYAGLSPMDTMYMHVNSPIPELDKVENAAVGPLVRKMLAKDPKDRYKSMSAIADELRHTTAVYVGDTSTVRGA